MAAQAVLALARLRALWQGSARLVGACWLILVSGACCRSSVVEHSIGNGEVDSSILSGSTSRFPSKPFKININPDSLLAADCISAVSAETNHEYLCQLVYKTGTTVHILSARPNGAACVRFASRDQPEVCCPPESSRLMDGFRTNRARCLPTNRSRPTARHPRYARGLEMGLKLLKVGQPLLWCALRCGFMLRTSGYARHSLSPQSL